jgi:hypothetical protein
LPANIRDREQESFTIPDRAFLHQVADSAASFLGATPHSAASPVLRLASASLAAGSTAFASSVLANCFAEERRPMYFHNVEISVGGNVHPIRAAFMPDLSTNGHGLLGQNGF